MENERNRLKWSGAGFTRRPVWSKDPDLAIIKHLAQKHLLLALPSDFDDANFHVQFFAQGGFNKLYRVSYDTHPTSYMFRVTLPTDPFFKVESEAATLAFVRAKTSIPVAQVIAWDSNWDTDLGFEWILTEMIEGVTLHDIWRQVPWERKLSLTEEVARMIVQLQRHEFDCIGSLYFASALRIEKSEEDMRSQERNVENSDGEVSVVVGSEKVEIENLTIGSSSPAVSLDENSSSVAGTEREETNKDPDSAPNFTIGHMFDEVFVSESRVYLPGNRGPFSSSLIWMQAAVEMQINYINRGLSLPSSKTEDSEYDTSFQKNAPKMKQLCHDLQSILPQIFQDEKSPSGFVLHHHDISAANILVHPTTYAITGLLDWELTCVVPKWVTATVPAFLDYVEYDWESNLSKGEPPLPPSWDEEKDGYAIEDYDRWAYRQLREHFNAALELMRREDGVVEGWDAAEVRLKREVQREIGDVVNGWQGVDWWVRKYRNGGVDPDPETSSSDEESDAQDALDDENCVEGNELESSGGQVSEESGIHTE
ncbi:MAG: hypothetical protein Q9195_002349 [Heterodermia aff. obscurata]